MTSMMSTVYREFDLSRRVKLHSKQGCMIASISYVDGRVVLNQLLPKELSLTERL